MKTRYYVLILMLPFFMASCSDDPASGLNPDDIPPVPSFELQMDLSVFKDNPEQSVTTQNQGSYTQASYIAMAVEGTMTGLAMWPSIFFHEDMWGEPSLVNGIYTWEYSYAYEGESMSFKITANELPNNEVDWQMRFSLQTAEASFDDELFIRAIVRSDDSAGSWEIYDLENPGEALAKLDYTKEGGEPNYISLSLYDDATSTSQLEYQKNNNESSLHLIENELSVTEIVWDNQTGAGYIRTEEEGKACWDENYQDTPCS